MKILSIKKTFYNLNWEKAVDTKTNLAKPKNEPSQIYIY